MPRLTSDEQANLPKLTRSIAKFFADLAPGKDAEPADIDGYLNAEGLSLPHGVDNAKIIKLYKNSRLTGVLPEPAIISNLQAVLDRELSASSSVAISDDEFNETVFTRQLFLDLNPYVGEKKPEKTALLAAIGADPAARIQALKDSAKTDVTPPLSALYLRERFRKLQSQEPSLAGLEYREFVALLGEVAKHSQAQEMFAKGVKDRVLNASSPAEIEARNNLQLAVLLPDGGPTAANLNPSGALTGLIVKVVKGFNTSGLDLKGMLAALALEPVAGASPAAADAALSAKIDEDIKNAVLAAENKAATDIQRIFRGHAAKKVLEDLKKAKAEADAAAKPATPPAEAPKKPPVLDDTWPKYLTRAQMQDAGYSDQLVPEILGQPGSSGKGDHGFEVWPSYAVAIYSGVAGSHALSQQVLRATAAAVDSTTEKVSIVKIEGLQAEPFYGLVTSTTRGTSLSFLSQEVFDREIKSQSDLFYKAALVEMISADPAGKTAIQGDVAKCLEIYEKQIAKYEKKIEELERLNADDPEIEKLRGLIEGLDQSSAILTTAADKTATPADLKKAIEQISRDVSAESKLFDDVEKNEIRSLRDVTLKTATDEQKDKARRASTSDLSTHIMNEVSIAMDHGAKYADLDSAEVDKVAKEMTGFFGDAKKAKRLLEQPIPHTPFSGVSILRPRGTNTATVLFNNDQSANNIVYLAIPGTGVGGVPPAYVRCVRLVPGQPTDIFKDGKPVSTSWFKAKAGAVQEEAQVRMDTGTIWTFDEKTGQHHPVSTARAMSNSALDKAFCGQGASIRDKFEQFSVKAIAIDGEDRSMAIMSGGRTINTKLSGKILTTKAGANEALVVKVGSDGVIQDGVGDTIPESITIGEIRRPQIGESKRKEGDDGYGDKGTIIVKFGTSKDGKKLVPQPMFRWIDKNEGECEEPVSLKSLRKVFRDDPEMLRDSSKILKDISGKILADIAREIASKKFVVETRNVDTNVVGTQSIEMKFSSAVKSFLSSETPATVAKKPRATELADVKIKEKTGSLRATEPMRAAPPRSGHVGGR